MSNIVSSSTSVPRIRLGIVGSRAYPRFEDVLDFIRDFVARHPDSIIEVVSGGQSQGVDGFARRAADVLHLPYTEFAPAHYHGAPYDVRNYHIRNEQIAHYCEVVHAFLFGGSRGTHSTIELCRRHGTPVVVHSA